MMKTEGNHNYSSEKIYTVKLNLNDISKAYSEPCQTSKIGI